MWLKTRRLETRVGAFDNSIEHLNMMTLLNMMILLEYDGTPRNRASDRRPEYQKKCHVQDVPPSDNVCHLMTPDAPSWHFVCHHGTWCASSGTWCAIMCMVGAIAMYLMVEGSRSRCMSKFDWLTPFMYLWIDGLNLLEF